MTLERVRDQSKSENAVERRAAELVQSFKLAEPSSVAKQRILFSLGSLRSRRAPRALSWALVAAAVVLVTGAVAGLGMAFRRYPAQAPTLEPTTTAVVPPSKDNSTVPEDVAQEPASSSSAVNPGRSSSALGAASAHKAASSEESVFVIDAMTALRREHDPAKAMGLLDRYLAVYPRGALHEEALVLAVEATSASHDPRAPQFAREYLQKYPTGRFAESARRIVARSSP